MDAVSKSQTTGQIAGRSLAAHISDKLRLNEMVRTKRSAITRDLEALEARQIGVAEFLLAEVWKMELDVLTTVRDVTIKNESVEPFRRFYDTGLRIRQMLDRVFYIDMMATVDDASDRRVMALKHHRHAAHTYPAAAVNCLQSSGRFPVGLGRTAKLKSA